MRLSQSQGLIALARDDLAAGRVTRRATALVRLMWVAFRPITATTAEPIRHPLAKPRISD
jgi:hypothetical protein